MASIQDLAKRRSALASAAAKALPGVGEGVACAGTPLESRTFTVGGKAFLFVGAKELRLKLASSAPEAARLAKRPSSAIRVGTGGWTTIRLAEGDVPDDAVLERWVAESRSLFERPSAPPAAGSRNGPARKAPKRGTPTRRRPD